MQVYSPNITLYLMLLGPSDRFVSKTGEVHSVLILMKSMRTKSELGYEYVEQFSLVDKVEPLCKWYLC